MLCHFALKKEESMHLLKFSQSAVRRLMRLADQVSFGLLVAGTTTLPASAASGTTVWTKASEIKLKSRDTFTSLVESVPVSIWLHSLK